MEKYIAARTRPRVGRGKTHFTEEEIVDLTYLATIINA
jgi:alkylhydroperoxidase family enzyme